jgi:hypothetical protein
MSRGTVLSFTSMGLGRPWKQSIRTVCVLTETWRDRGKRRKPSSSIAGIQTEIWNLNISNTNEGCKTLDWIRQKFYHLKRVSFREGYNEPSGAYARCLSVKREENVKWHFDNLWDIFRPRIWFHSGFFSLVFNPEDGRDMFLRKVNWLSKHYTTTYGEPG